MVVVDDFCYAMSPVTHLNDCNALNFPPLVCSVSNFPPLVCSTSLLSLLAVFNGCSSLLPLQHSFSLRFFLHHCLNSLYILVSRYLLLSAPNAPRDYCFSLSLCVSSTLATPVWELTFLSFSLSLSLSLFHFSVIFVLPFSLQFTSPFQFGNKTMSHM